MDNKDIDEIIYHIRKLRKTDSDDSSSQSDSKNEPSTSMTKDTNEKKISVDTKTVGNELVKVEEENIMESNAEIEEIEPVSVMKPEVVGWTDSSTATCDLCDKDIVLGKNLSGLVIADEFFACEDCCQKLSREDLMEWTKSKMVSNVDVRPIGLWVIEQQRENRKQDMS